MCHLIRHPVVAFFALDTVEYTSINMLCTCGIVHPFTTDGCAFRSDILLQKTLMYTSRNTKIFTTRDGMYALEHDAS